MNGMIKILSIILIIQIGLAIYVNVGGDSLGAFKTDEKLVNVSLTDINKIEIEEPGKDVLSLEMKESRWVIPSLYNAPASKEKVNKFTDKLFGFKKSFPVSKTKIAAKKLKLTKDDFERRIALSKGSEKVSELFFGTSPSFKKIHTRRADEDQSYAVEFGAHEISTKPKEWLDILMLKLDREKISRIVFNGFNFVRSGENLVLDGLTDNEESNALKVNELVGSIVNVQVKDVLGTEAKPEYNLDKPEIKFSVEYEGQGEIAYAISKLKDKDDYVLKVSTYPFYFEISKSTYSQLIDKDRNQFIKDAKPVDVAKDEAEESAAEEAVESEAAEKAAEPEAAGEVK